MEWFAVAVVVLGMTAAFVWLALFHRMLKQFGDLTKELRGSDTSLKTRRENTADVDDGGIAKVAKNDTRAVPRRMIHDLNNSIGTIAGFTDAALEDLPGDNPVCGDLLEIKEATRKVKSIVKKLDEMSKGESRQESTSNRPVVSSTPGTEATSSRREFPTGSEHLLIVDDEVQLLRMFRRFFEPLGYQVTTFSDSIKARDAFKLQHGGYDLAIVDERMPELSGSRLAEAMLSVRPDLPIILLSGYSDPVSPAEASQIGIRRFLSKPIPQAELNATVRSVLDEEAREEL